MAGRYRLLEALATGGMATVYLARQRGRAGFARTVAVKRMHPHFAGQHDFKVLFIDEARLAARVTHPNVVQTLDVVEDDDELFIVMEYVRGLPLSQLQRLADAGHGIPIDVAVSIAVGTLNGLHAAHDAKDETGHPLGIVHRDVSPQNILVGVDGVARLIDFGVAKAVSQLHTTREGELRGKLAYMAPEQIRGGVADRQTDVFSASVVLWQSLAGRRLFVGSNDGELIYRLLEAEVLPPSTHRAGVSPELDRIVVKGLSRDRAERYETAVQMAHDLEKFAKMASQRAVAEFVQDVAHEVLKERSAVLSELLEQASLHDDPDTLGALRASLTSSPSLHADGSKTPRMFPMDPKFSKGKPSEDGTDTVPLPGPDAEVRAAETDSQLSVDTRWARPRRQRPALIAAGVVALGLLVALFFGQRSDDPVSVLSKAAPELRAFAARAQVAAPPAPASAEPALSASAAPTATLPVAKRKPRVGKPFVPHVKPQPTVKSPSLYKRE